MKWDRNVACNLGEILWGRRGWIFFSLPAFCCLDCRSDACKLSSLIGPWTDRPRFLSRQSPRQTYVLIYYLRHNSKRESEARKEGKQIQSSVFLSKYSWFHDHGKIHDKQDGSDYCQLLAIYCPLLVRLLTLGCPLLPAAGLSCLVLPGGCWGSQSLSVSSQEKHGQWNCRGVCSHWRLRAHGGRR